MVRNPNHRAPPADARPETELVLCCARTQIDSKTAARVKDLAAGGLDWAYVVQTALTHGVMPLLYRGLNTACPEAVPTASLERLRDHFRANARRNLRLTARLLRVLSLLESHAITAIPYKGPTLAGSVYGDISLRQFADLDILVHQRDVLRAKDLLATVGYRLLTTFSGEATPHYVLQGDDPGHLLELEWGIAPLSVPCTPDPDGLWQRLQPQSVAGKSVLSLSTEDLLLILCIHGSKPSHSWGRLKWVCDVAELIRVHRELDWKQVMEQARTFRAERMLFLGLLLACDLLDAALPEEVSQRIGADSVVQSLGARVRQRLFGDVDSPPAVLGTSHFDLRASDRLRDKIRYYLRVALTVSPPDQALLRLPATLSYLYYLVRPIRLTVKHALHPRKTWVKLRQPLTP